ncbi:hypothetical protein NL676_013882 [Syzygium grande]|nr:hypothetical protein NL676_013882 [Syzygium grande]
MDKITIFRIAAYRTLGIRAAATLAWHSSGGVDVGDSCSEDGSSGTSKAAANHDKNTEDATESLLRMSPNQRKRWCWNSRLLNVSLVLMETGLDSVPRNRSNVSGKSATFRD